MRQAARPDTLILLDYEAKKNPALGAIVSNLEYMTEDEIQNAPIRVLPWVRQALLRLKKKVDFETVMARTNTQMKDLIIDGVVPDTTGETRRWTGDNTFINLRRGQLEIRPGELFWVDTKGGVWIDSIYSYPIDPRLMTFSVSCGQMSRLAYMEALRARARGHSNPSDPVLISDVAKYTDRSPLMGNPSLMNAGVRFFQPG